MVKFDIEMTPGIYVHLPFCAVHCSYCDFPISTRTSLADAYYKALLREIALRPASGADTLYFGGGTPSMTPPGVIREIKSRFLLEPDAEVTLEANPDDITEEHLSAWRELGITRLSVGIQTLQEAPLRVMRRKHTVDEALRAVELIRKSGFCNVSYDLIIGSPEQTVDGFLDGLRTLLEFHPQHFSLYMLELHERTLLHQLTAIGTLQPMHEDAQVECYRKAIALLQSHGYEQYEVSNFALGGFDSRHNLKYWNGAPYYGYGAGACAYLPPARIKNVAPLPQYIQMLDQGQLPVEAQVLEDRTEVMRNTVIFGLRKKRGISLSEFERDFGVPAASIFEDGIDDLIRDGFIEVSSDRLSLTLEGMLLSNDILSRVI